jgi:hypothetical protein
VMERVKKVFEVQFVIEGDSDNLPTEGEMLEALDLRMFGKIQIDSTMVVDCSEINVTSSYRLTSQEA